MNIHFNFPAKFAFIIVFFLRTMCYGQDSLIPVKCLGGVLMSQPDYRSEIIFKVPPNAKIFVFNNFYENDYYKARYEDKMGYITRVVLYPNEELTALTDSITTVIVKREKREKFLAELKHAEDDKERLKKRERDILRKYGNVIGQRILNREYWIGMKSGEAIESLGDPEKINRTTHSSGVHEQWVYKGAYLYFENGILRSYQD